MRRRRSYRLARRRGRGRGTLTATTARGASSALAVLSTLALLASTLLRSARSRRSPASRHRRLAARGRLALLLAGMPGQWQGVFLTPAPWPPEFVEAMKKSYLAAGPRFAQLTMVPKPLEFNAIGSGAAQWWETMDRQPIIRLMFIILLVGFIVVTLWYLLLH